MYLSRSSPPVTAGSDLPARAIRSGFSGTNRYAPSCANAVLKPRGYQRSVARTRTSTVDEARARALGSGRFIRSMKPFQERDLAKLLALDHGANFSVPGAREDDGRARRLPSGARRSAACSSCSSSPRSSAFDAWMVDSVDCLSARPCRFTASTAARSRTTPSYSSSTISASPPPTRKSRAFHHTG